MTMKSPSNLLRATVPKSILLFLRSLKSTIRLARNSFYDFGRFLRHSATRHATDYDYVNEAQLRSLMTMEYHAVEKGLSLREPRPGFGMQRIARLVELIEKYLCRFGSDRVVEISLACLNEYAVFNEKHGMRMDELRETIRTLDASSRTSTHEKAVISLDIPKIKKASSVDLSAFFKSRHSIRDFGPEEVSIETIRDAIQMAIYTPSVCNRQSWKVHVLNDKAVRESALRLQNGNRGFGHLASKVLVVTSDLRSFVSVGERNQGWIDGGMFAMSLVFALHSFSLATCCLNWSAPLENDVDFRSVTGIPDWESIIMLVAVGHYPDHVRAARSERHDVSHFLSVR